MKTRERALRTILLSLVAVAAGLTGCLGTAPEQSTSDTGGPDGPGELPVDEQPCANHHITMQYEGESLSEEGLEQAFSQTGWGFQPSQEPGEPATVTPQAEGIEVLAFYEENEELRTVVIEVAEGADPTAHRDRVDAVAMEAAQEMNATFPDAQLTLWEVDEVAAC